MNAQRAIGVVLIGVGAILLFVGINASQSVVDQVSDTFTGRFTDRTTWFLIGGVASALLGVLLLFVGPRARLI